MSKSICLLCHNTECDNSQQFKEDHQVCSAFKDKKVIDWEQRRYEIVKDIVTSYVQYYGNETPIGKKYCIGDAISIANEIIKRLKEK